MKKLFSLLLAATMTFSLTLPALADHYTYSEPEKSTMMPRSTPETHGMSSQYILDLLDAFDYADAEVHNILMAIDGEVVFEGHYAPYTALDPHIMFSEVVDKECGLRPVTAQAGQVFNDNRFDLARFDHLIDFVDSFTVEVHTADIVIGGFAHHLVAVADRKVIYDFPLVIQRIQFFILISGQPIIEPDFHNRSFPLWCADHARHTIAHKFLNS